MKRKLLLCLAFMICLSVNAQKARIKNGMVFRNCQKEQTIFAEPVKNTIAPIVKRKQPALKKGANTNIVTVLDLGTSANVIGYSGGTRPMVWADDDLNCVINFHRAGPGATPPNLSGYYAMDLGLNRGATQADWTNQILVSTPIYPASTYWFDAGNYPCAGIYNPGGGTTLANAWCSFFGPNNANMVVPGFGGYTSGAANLSDYTDTNRALRWYAPPPYTYIPDGFWISGTGIAHMVDGDYNVESGTKVYQDSIIYGRGVWNPVTLQHDYWYDAIPFPCVDSYGMADCKIAAFPDGNIVWMSVLTNFVGATPLIDSTWFPVLRRSTDGGVTWEDPIVIQLDGPNGLDGVKNAYSDYFISNLFSPPLPTRDEIPYTTAFDHSLTVDKYGNPHIGVAVGFAPGAYSITTGIDSLINVFDIYSFDDGFTWNAVRMGALKTFRGTWAGYTCDNRVYISRTKTGDLIFVTWNDTDIEGEPNNQNPEVWARGFHLIHNCLTSYSGLDAPTNVTFLSDITQEAYWQCTSPIVFTDDNKYTIPICTQWFADASADVSFKYISDFSFSNDDFSIPNPNWPWSFCWTGIDQKNDEPPPVIIFPNPVEDFLNITVNLKNRSTVTIEVSNLFGEQMLFLDKGKMDAGSQQVQMDVSTLLAGIYFITVTIDGNRVARKMIVE